MTLGAISAGCGLLIDLDGIAGPAANAGDSSVSPDGGDAESVDSSDGPRVAPDADSGYSTIVFQHSVSPTASYGGASDTELSAAAPDTNFGARTPITADADEPSGSSMPAVTLLRWHVTDIPHGSTVMSASITLNVVGASKGAFPVYPVSRPWSESAATWRRATADAAWETAGALGASDRMNVVVAVLAQPALGTFSVPLNAAGSLASRRGWMIRRRTTASS